MQVRIITRWFIISLVLGEMRWCLSFCVASFSSEFVLMMMMRFLMREREFFVRVREREREKGEGDRCEGWSAVQSHKTLRETRVSRFYARCAIRDRPVRGGFRRERFLFFSLFLRRRWCTKPHPFSKMLLCLLLVLTSLFLLLFFLKQQKLNTDYTSVASFWGTKERERTNTKTPL